MRKLPKDVQRELDENLHLGRWASVIRDLPPSQRTAALRYVTEKRVGSHPSWWKTRRQRGA